jgi:hypothetical protein
MKDNDLKNKLHMPKEITKAFFQQIQKDCQFLYSIGVMDYSLLIGIHNKEFDVSASASASSTSPTAAGASGIKRASVLLNKAPLGARVGGDEETSSAPAAATAEREIKNDDGYNVDDVSLKTENVLLRKHEVSNLLSCVLLVLDHPRCLLSHFFPTSYFSFLFRRIK